MNKQESKFVLDCKPPPPTHFTHYVPSFDYNLHEFFENKIVQKDLANKGFIDSKGFVNYDPYYGKAMGIPKKKSNRYTSAISHSNLIKKQVETNVKNMKTENKVVKSKNREKTER